MVLLRQQLRLYLLRQLYQRYLQHRTCLAMYLVLRRLLLHQYLHFLLYQPFLLHRTCLAK